MKEGYVDDFDLMRIVNAIEDELVLKPLEQPEVVVQNHTGDDTTGHIVNLDSMDCTCEDYKYNCKSEMKSTSDNKYCKHIYRVVLEKHRMLQA